MAAEFRNKPLAIAKGLTGIIIVLLGIGAAAQSRLAAGKGDGSDAPKSAIHVLADGFPTGHDTPEGAACDLARAFIDFEPKLFDQTCIAPFGGGANRAKYEQFLKDVRQSIADEGKKDEKSPNGLKTIGKLFAARHLSKDGPASYGYATYNFRDVQFVDVGVVLRSGQRSLNRTVVIQEDDGKWYVHPFPESCPLLSDGLNDEPPSTKDFREAYTIQK